MSYNFCVIWMPGKTHHIADTLSRAPVFDTQCRYSIVELECLAIVNAIHKCHCYLAGIKSFKVRTDYSPLVGAFD